LKHLSSAPAMLKFKLDNIMGGFIENFAQNLKNLFAGDI
jgi:hypothetical protein